MNYTNDENCCFIVIKRPYDNDNNRNFPQEMMFKNDNRFGYDDKYDDNWQDFDGRDCDNFDHDRRPHHNDCWKCNCRKCNERKCDNHNDRPNKRRCGPFNFIRFC